MRPELLAAETSPLPSNINTTVPGHPGLAYFDLLKQLVPDLQPKDTIASGTATAMPVRYILGPFGQADGRAKLPNKITFGSFQVRTAMFEGRTRILILVSVGAVDAQRSTELLIAYSDEAKPKLLDVVDVAMDRTVRFGDTSIVNIGPHDQGVMTTSQHAEGDDNHLADALLFMRNDKFEPIDVFFRFEQIGCGFERRQTTHLVPQKAASDGPYNDLKLTIRDTGALLENGCDQSWGEAPYTLDYSALYQRDGATASFVADTSQIDILRALSATWFQ